MQAARSFFRSTSAASSSSSPPRTSASVELAGGAIVTNSDVFSLDEGPSFKTSNPMFATSGNSRTSASINSTLSRGASGDDRSRGSSIIFDNEQAATAVPDEEGDDDFFEEDLGPASLSSATAAAERRTAAFVNSDSGCARESSLASRGSSSVSDFDSSSFDPSQGIRLATPYVVFLLLLQGFLSLLWVGAVVAPQLPDDYYNSTDPNDDSVCASNFNVLYKNSTVPLSRHPHVYLMLSDSSSPICIMILAVIFLSNPRGRLAVFECLSVALVVISFLGNIFMPSLPTGSRVGFLVVLLFSVYMISALIRRRRVIASLSDKELSAIVLDKLPTVTVAIVAPLLFVYNDSISCMVNNFTEPRLCEDKIRSNGGVSVLVVIVAMCGIYDFRLGKNEVNMASLLRFDFDPFRAQMFIVAAFFECCVGLYLYASGTAIQCYDQYMNDDSSSRSYLSRTAARFTFHFLWGALFVLITAGTFLGKSTELEKRIRARLLTKRTNVFAPMVIAALIGAVCLLSIAGCVFVQKTVSLNSSLSSVEDPEEYFNSQEFKERVLVLNVVYTATKFSRVAVSMLGVAIFMSSPKRRHRVRFLWGSVIPFVTNLLVLSALLRVPVDGNGEKVLFDWEHEKIVSLMLFAVPILVLPAQNASRNFLGLQSDAEIDLHFQKSLYLSLMKLPPAVYLFSETTGCVLSSDSMDTCEMLSECNFSVVLYIGFSCAYYLLFNHAQSHLQPESYVNFRGVDGFTLLSFFWEGLACALAYACFGLRPTGVNLEATASDDAWSELTGFEKESHEETVVRTVVLTFTRIIGYGYFVVMTIGFFSLRHAVVLAHASLSGGSGEDVDVLQSSKVARCWISLEKLLEKWLTRITVPEGDVSTSGIHKRFLVGVVWIPLLFCFFGYFCVGMDSVDPRLWLRGVALVEMGSFTTPISVFAVTAYMFCDMQTELSARSRMFIIGVPTLTMTLFGFFGMLNGNYIRAGLNTVFGVFYGLGFSVFIDKRRLIMTSTGPSFRKQKLLDINSALYAFAPTVIFLVSERFACLADASFNTAALRNKESTSADNLLNNAVTRYCENQGTGSLSLLWSCVWVAGVRMLTYKKKMVTTQRLATMQLSYLDLMESFLHSLLLIWGIVLFSFRKTSSLRIRMGTLDLSWYLFIFILVVNLIFSYIRDRATVHETEVEALRPSGDTAACTPQEREHSSGRPSHLISKMGESTRTKNRRNVIQLWKDPNNWQSPSVTKSRALSDTTPHFDLNPGLM